MFLFRCFFKPMGDRDTFCSGTLTDYLGALYRSGQVVGDWTVTADGDAVVVHCAAPDENSLDANNDNIVVREARRRLLETTSEQPSCLSLGAIYDCTEPCRCGFQSLVLFTYYSRREPPVVCGNCGGHVALYRLPFIFGDTEHNEILAWERLYKACHALDVYSSVGERFGILQTCGPWSQLTKKGLDICRETSEQLRNPVYYYLCGHEGRKLTACPRCGRRVASEDGTVGRFRLLCDRCLLVTLSDPV